MAKTPQFFKEIKEVLVKHKLEEIIAPAILSRKSFINFNPKQVLYEIIESQPYTSVLINKSSKFIEKFKKQGGNLIRTTWPVSNKEQTVLCATYCDQFHVYEH